LGVEIGRQIKKTSVSIYKIKKLWIKELQGRRRRSLTIELDMQAMLKQTYAENVKRCTKVPGTYSSVSNARWAQNGSGLYFVCHNYFSNNSDTEYSVYKKPPFLVYRIQLGVAGWHVGSVQLKHFKNYVEIREQNYSQPFQ
jgi:hypothetical protein